MNRDLLEKIYTLYAEELRLYLYSLCRDTAVAEDLMQDVFVNALMSLSDSDEASYKREDVATKHFISMLNYMSDNEKFCRMMKTDENGFDPQSAVEYVKDNGLTIYGFVTRADKDKLLELLVHDEIYTVYVK